MEILIGIAIGAGITILTGKLLGFTRSKSNNLPYIKDGDPYSEKAIEPKDPNTPKDNR